MQFKFVANLVVASARIVGYYALLHAQILYILYTASVWYCSLLHTVCNYPPLNKLANGNSAAGNLEVEGIKGGRQRLGVGPLCTLRKEANISREATAPPSICWGALSDWSPPSTEKWIHNKGERPRTARVVQRCL